MIVWMSVLAVAMTAAIALFALRRIGASRIEALTNKRRPTSRVVSSGELVDGNRHMKVALALTKSDLFYENADMQASLDLRWIHEVEYDSRLATGGAIGAGEVLRIRSASRVVEFVLPTDAAPKWHLMLPARRAAAIAAETVVVPQ